MAKSKKSPWTAGKCSCTATCPMTLVTYIGGGQYACWLHALVLGLPVTAPGNA